jgi:serine protease AprX
VALVLLGGLVPGAEAQLLLDAPALAPPPVLHKLDPLMQARVSDLSGRSRVIVRAAAAALVPEVRLLIEQTGGTPGRTLSILEAVAADIPNAALATLTNNPLVRRVALDRLVGGALDRTAATIGAHAVRQELGYDGSGVGVAVIDSGVTAWHDDLTAADSPGSQRVDRFVDLIGGLESAYDDYGHGTHVAGIIAGNGYDSSGRRIGIAPGARLIVLKVLDGSGRGHISDVIAALGYVVDHRLELNVRVVNLSIGAGVYESYETDLLPLAAKRAADAGLVIVAAAGNAGTDRDGHRQYGAITAPGNAPWVLTVGASSHRGTLDRADDTVARFSSRGPTAIDHAAKPDLVAPGVGVVSLSDPNSLLYTSRAGSLLDGAVATSYLPYLSLSGTSQATPVVAGTVALMLQANPSLTPNAVKAILQYTAESHPTYDALTQGAGFLDAQGAVNLAVYFAAPHAAAYPASPRGTRQLIWGNQRARNGRLMPDVNAWGADVVWGSTVTPHGATVEWGVVDGDCGGDSCETAAWRYEDAGQNVVWGGTCGGADCDWQTWSVSDQTVVWGSTEDGDAVVWGCDSEGETVVWGSTDAEDTTWDACCEERSPAF